MPHDASSRRRIQRQLLHASVFLLYLVSNGEVYNRRWDAGDICMALSYLAAMDQMDHTVLL
jgi:hypothetical protein